MNNQSMALNPLITLAMPLLIILIQIRRSQSSPNVAKLREQIIHDIQSFQQNVSSIISNPKIVLAARYCLCTAIDEAVLNTSWGNKSIWTQQTLLSVFHQETQGGERFYIILDEMIKNREAYRGLLEFQYLLLSLGFEGRFFGKQKMIREEIRNRLYQTIRELQGKTARILSPQWQDQPMIKSSFYKKWTLRKILTAFIGSIVIVTVITNLAAYQKTRDLLNRIDALGRDNPIVMYSQLVDKSVFRNEVF